jgi:tRNA 2-selenouridine synthase
MPEHLSVSSFLMKAVSVPVLDVRSPGEFEQGHIPGALSFPLFTDEERKEVGTLYKNAGKDKAFLKGLEFVGPKMAGFVRQAVRICPEKEVAVHCWRGGMRSGSMAWLLESAGFKVFLLKGGYKLFRQSVLTEDRLPERMLVLGGLTGSGKTPVLHALAASGFQVLDLERLANHKGSAFGSLGENPQPTQEQFENEIYTQLFHSDPERILWVEDESKAIGRVRVPNELYDRIRDSKVVFLDQKQETRLGRIVELYGTADPEALSDSIRKLAKRLGGLRLKTALDAVQCGDLREAASLVLEYYDKAYLFGLYQRNPENRFHVDCLNVPDDSIPALLADVAETLYPGRK